ncbi:telomeric template RNA reverse transcriptase, putative [Cryptococcus gattii WM276]|uniref:Telomerase reverse transcriptase n=2 Tax=Cryptococcus gattii TaxID=37769 RepID=E6R6X4_CRYGW|nr:telomeric template RNA reverse transcriptase, putative [Cryptococcus gattii WM276]ADV22435.1 telomeric template RNA reverse transcriptase, putative [Cryptococcus gattii WM276]KIR78541.1 telomerase reverse transcriptase [Cryptococcus gattii EJB2]
MTAPFDRAPAKTQQRTLPPTLHHKTLSAYYPYIYTLSQFISSRLEDFESQRHTSNTTAFSTFLTSTLCAFRNEDELNRVELDKDRRVIFPTQQEAIDKALSHVAKASSGPGKVQNLLLLRTSSSLHIQDLPINMSRPSVPNQTIQGPAGSFRSSEWQLLRSRIGDKSFSKLLLGTSLFSPVGNNCYLQLSGIPLYELYEEDHHRVSVSKMELSRKRKRGPETNRKYKRKRSKSTAVIQAEDCSENRANVKEKEDDRIPSNTNILRQRMFYGRPYWNKQGVLSHGLPPSHILNALKRGKKSHEAPSDVDCLSLLDDIFPQLVDSNKDISAFTTENLPKRLEGMIGIAREIIVRHNRLNYEEIMKHCLERMNRASSKTPPPYTEQSAWTVTPAQSNNQALPNNPLIPKTHRQVSMLVRHHYCSLFIFYANHGKPTQPGYASCQFITAKQFETTSLHSLNQNLRINDFRWLHGNNRSGQRVAPGEMKKRKELVLDLIHWIFECFLIPLIKNSFYVTETATTKYETVYYSQKDWNKAVRPHYRSLQDNLLEEIDKNEVDAARRGVLGVSTARLIPKPTGFRPIVNLGRKIEMPDTTNSKRKSWSANQILGNVHKVLTSEKDRQKHRLGGALFGTNEIFPPLQKLKFELTKKHGNLPQLYFIKTDIKAAFDSIKQDKMLKILEDMLRQSSEYRIILYSVLLPPGHRAYQGTSKRLFKSKAIPTEDVSLTFADHAKDIADSMRNAAIVDMVRRHSVTTQECLNLLRSHIKDNTWKVGKQYFRQKTGIPQGSKVSTLLCTMFYSYLENEHLSWTRREGSLLLRYIDDFLFITDNYNLARRFVDVMSRGFPEYGARISVDKTLLSFEYDTGKQLAPVCSVNDQGDVADFPYCGFLIRTGTLDIMPDFTRLLNYSIKQSFARRSTRKQGSSFLTWYSRQLENRNHVALLDTVHNGLGTVMMNVFINFAMTTMKVPHYFKGMDSSVNFDRLVFASMLCSTEYTFYAGRARVLHYVRTKNTKNLKAHFSLKKEEFVLLAITAMSHVLRRKTSRFKGVVDLLEAEAKKRVYRGLSEKLAVVCDKGWDAVKDARY